MQRELHLLLLQVAAAELDAGDRQRRGLQLRQHGGAAGGATASAASSRQRQCCHAAAPAALMRLPR